MPKVPSDYARDITQEQSPVTGEKYVAPENLLIAAAHMNQMGRMFGEGGGGFRPPKSGRAKPSKSLKVR